MKKALLVLVAVGASTFVLPKTSQASEETIQQDICCASENSCLHPIYGRVFLSTLMTGSTCTVVDS